MLALSVLIVSLLASLAIGAFVLARDPKQTVNQVYILLTLSFMTFSVANYMTLTPTENMLTYIRIVICATTIANAALFFLLLLVRDEGHLHKKRLTGWQTVIIFSTVLVALLDFTPLVFSGLTLGGQPTPIPGPLAPLFVVHFLSVLLSGMFILWSGIRESHGIKRLQMAYMLIGILPMFIFAPITSFILPVLLQNTRFIFLTPLYAFLFVSIIGYAIVKHKLFDVRAALARSLGYIVTVLFISLMYGELIVYLTQRSTDSYFSGVGNALVVSAIAVSGVMFARVKKTFDKLTNRYFYRDAYDAQELFNELNQSLATNIQIRSILSSSSETIGKYLKADYVTFIVNNTDGSPMVISGDENRASIAQKKHLGRELAHQNAALVNVEDQYSAHSSEIKKSLQIIKADLAMGLLSKVKEQQPIGYMILGQKRTGNPYSSQDIAVLQTISNELVLAIQNALHYEEIQNFNTTLQQRVDDATRKLRRTNQRLKELDEAKDDFVSMASHQLRTPLTAIKGNVSLVMEGDAGPVTKTQVELLGQAFASSQRMVFLIADLLNVSRLKTGKFVIEPGRVNLADMVAQEVTQLQETAQSRQVSLAFAKPETFSTLKLDETKTRQVIMNFIDNAIYYTQSGGAIEVSLKETDKEVEFRVKDNGIGVPRHEQPHLFTKFYRAENARKARPDGTGLGLFMAKKIIVAQGGAIIFETKEGKGSTFGFRFPKAHLVV